MPKPRKRKRRRSSTPRKPGLAISGRQLSVIFAACLALALAAGWWWNDTASSRRIERTTPAPIARSQGAAGFQDADVASTHRATPRAASSSSSTHEAPPRATPMPQSSPVMPPRDAGNVAPPRRRRRTEDAGSRQPVLAKSSLLDVPKSARVLSFTEHPAWAPSDEQTKARFVWGAIPDSILQKSLTSPQRISNMRPEDYAGAKACQTCHAKNYESWSVHPHRWMNARANEESVMGDFSGDASISYRGGQAKFYMQDAEYRMRLERDSTVRVYSVNRTIGSRFQQYYVGKLIEGPEPEKHPVRQIDYVLPFGYWLDENEWVPVVHVDLELPDEQRHDPFLHPANRAYDRSCASCHTTQVAGDRMLRAVGRERLAAYSPHDVVFDGFHYLKQNRNEVLEYADYYAKTPTDRIKKALSVMDDLAAEKYAAALGVTCEGCHNGAKFHANHEERKPLFYPSGEQLAVMGGDVGEVWGRNTSNVNWTCAQCHTGGRSMFACGASTWNSTEYSDAMRGSCYDPMLAKAKSMECLTCVHCHDPHVATGKAWKHSPNTDDQRCIACHDQFLDAKQRLAHTHHPAGTPGDRCMNCHMPKINEGMQDVVRTHLIFSPTDTAMLEANHPNACNLCHLDKGIDWTLTHLENWYDLQEKSRAGDTTEHWKIYDAARISANYPARSEAVSLGWLNSENEATRLVALEALAKANAKWALPDMLQMLDDDYLVNRQFAAQRLEEMLDVDLEKEFGYRYYQYRDERKKPLNKIRTAVLRNSK